MGRGSVRELDGNRNASQRRACYVCDRVASPEGSADLAERAPEAVDELVVIVDADNRPIDVVRRSLMRAKGLRHRATAIFVIDRKGRLFVQRRTDTKDIDPGMLDLAAGGVVTAGESYEECAVREVAEELGVIDTPLEAVFDSYYSEAGKGGRPPNRLWSRVFVCRHDGPFTLQPEEVASGEFVTLADILADDAGRYTPDTFQALRELLERGTLPVPTS